MPAPIKDLVTHVWQRLDRSGRCWVWTGGRQGRGYGQLTVHYRRLLLHRVVYEWAFGEIPAGLVVRHTCDNPPCCNPAHLVIGTQHDNVRDMVERGRLNPWRASLAHCKRGHEFNESNTIRERDGSRSCRECQNAARRKPNGRGAYRPYEPTKRAA
jgi:hypothetical protein